MITMLKRLSFKCSNSKNVLLIDILVIDLLPYDFPQDCLEKDVAPVLKKKYLSECQESYEQIMNKKIYQGHIIGHRSRMFVSIPTAIPKINKFVNVFYLLDTGSPFTTLTERALSAIHQKPTTPTYQYINYQIGNSSVRISSLEFFQSDKLTQPFPNVNLLGMNFLKNYSTFSINRKDFSSKFTLNLQKKNDWSY